MSVVARIAPFVALALVAAAKADTPSTAPSVEGVLAELKRLDASGTSRPAGTGQESQDASRRRAERKGELVKSLVVSGSDDPAAVAYLTQRWHGMQMARSPKLEAEIDDALPLIKSPTLLAEAYVNKINMTLFRQTKREQAYTAVRPIADAFAARVPNSKYLAGMYTSVASMAPDTATETDLLHKAVAVAKDPQEVLPAVSRLRTLDLVGKPLPLEFNEATSGKLIRMQDLAGKVVVLDFWATWCGPCVAEMPAMKKLYAEYKDKGVEFIGVSLDAPEDEGGLTALKTFITKNQITWPQYYQGKMWDADFSSSLGIMSVPTMIVIDANGKVASIDARGNLDTILPNLLAPRPAATRPAK